MANKHCDIKENAVKAILKNPISIYCLWAILLFLSGVFGLAIKENAPIIAKSYFESKKCN